MLVMLPGESGLGEAVFTRERNPQAPHRDKICATCSLSANSGNSKDPSAVACTRSPVFLVSLSSI